MTSAKCIVGALQPTRPSRPEQLQFNTRLWLRKQICILGCIGMGAGLLADFGCCKKFVLFISNAIQFIVGLLLEDSFLLFGG